MKRAPRRVPAALAAWGWRIKRQVVEVCVSVDGGLLYGTSCEGNVCRKHFTGVCGCRRIDAKLLVELRSLVPQHACRASGRGLVGWVNWIASLSMVLIPGHRYKLCTVLH